MNGLSRLTVPAAEWGIENTGLHDDRRRRLRRDRGVCLCVASSANPCVWQACMPSLPCMVLDQYLVMRLDRYFTYVQTIYIWIAS